MRARFTVLKALKSRVNNKKRSFELLLVIYAFLKKIVAAEIFPFGLCNVTRYVFLRKCSFAHTRESVTFCNKRGR